MRQYRLVNRRFYPTLRAFAAAITFLVLLSSCAKEPQEVLVEGISFVGISVSDLQKSSDLYTYAAGMESIQQAPLVAGPTIQSMHTSTTAPTTNLLRSANAQLLLMDFSPSGEAVSSAAPVDVYGPGIAHVCFQVASKTKTYQRFLSAGAQTMGDPEMVHLNPKNPVYYAYARDHDGIIFEIEHVDVDKLDLPEPPKNEYRIRHVSLATPDMSRIVDFYAQLLSQPKPRRAGRWLKLSGEKLDKVSGQPNSKIEMAWFQTRNLELEIIEYVSHPTDQDAAPRALSDTGYNMIVFDVTDINKATQRFTEAGGTILGEPEDFFGTPTTFGRDPDGNLIGLQVSASNQPYSSKHFADNGI